MKTVLVAAAALIDPDGRMLLARRPAGKAMAGLWEFPGGKIEPSELPERALVRELREELGIEVCISCLSPGPFVSWTYSETPPEPEEGCDCPVDVSGFIPASQMGVITPFHLLLCLFLCRTWDGVPQAREGQTLSWRTLAQMRDLPMPPADRPLVSALHGFL